MLASSLLPALLLFSVLAAEAGNHWRNSSLAFYCERLQVHSLMWMFLTCRGSWLGFIFFIHFCKHSWISGVFFGGDNGFGLFLNVAGGMNSL